MTLLSANQNAYIFRANDKTKYSLKFLQVEIRLYNLGDYIYLFIVLFSSQDKPTKIVSGKYCQCQNYGCDYHQEKMCGGGTTLSFVSKRDLILMLKYSSL